MKVALKELRETFNGLKIVKTVKWVSADKRNPILNENNQLISIFVSSIGTANRNEENNKKSISKKRGDNEHESKP